MEKFDPAQAVALPIGTALILTECLCEENLNTMWTVQPSNLLLRADGNALIDVSSYTAHLRFEIASVSEQRP